MTWKIDPNFLKQPLASLVFSGANGNKLCGIRLTAARNDVGDYTLSFAYDMPSADYSVLATASGAGNIVSYENKTASGFDLRCQTLSGGALQNVDPAEISVMVNERDQ